VVPSQAGRDWIGRWQWHEEGEILMRGGSGKGRNGWEIEGETDTVSADLFSLVAKRMDLGGGRQHRCRQGSREKYVYEVLNID